MVHHWGGIHFQKTTSWCPSLFLDHFIWDFRRPPRSKRPRMVRWHFSMFPDKRRRLFETHLKTGCFLCFCVAPISKKRVLWCFFFTKQLRWIANICCKHLLYLAVMYMAMAQLLLACFQLHSFDKQAQAIRSLAWVGELRFRHWAVGWALEKWIQSCIRLYHKIISIISYTT